MMKHMSVNEVMTMPTLAVVLLIPALVASFLFVRLCGRFAVVVGLVGDGSSNRRWLSALTQGGQRDGGFGWESDRR